MDVSDLMDVGTVADNKDSIIWYDNETCERIFNDDGSSTGKFLDLFGGDADKEKDFLQDVLVNDPEENGYGVEVTDIMAEGGYLALEVDHESLAAVLSERLETEKEDY